MNEKYKKLFDAVLNRRRVRKAIDNLGQAESYLVFTDYEKAVEINEIQQKLRKVERDFFEKVEEERVKFSGEEIDEAREIFYKMYHENL